MDKPEIIEIYKDEKEHQYRGVAGKARGARGLRERVLLQCIISSIVLAAALFINLIKTDFTNGLSLKIKDALSADLDAGAFGIGAGISKAEEFIAGALDYIKSAVGFGGESGEALTELEPGAHEEYSAAEEEASAAPEKPEKTGSGRIDEDMLEEINGREDFYNKQGDR